MDRNATSRIVGLWSVAVLAAIMWTTGFSHTQPTTVRAQNACATVEYGVFEDPQPSSKDGFIVHFPLTG